MCVSKDHFFFFWLFGWMGMKTKKQRNVLHIYFFPNRMANTMKAGWFWSKSMTLTCEQRDTQRRCFLWVSLRIPCYTTNTSVSLRSVNIFTAGNIIFNQERPANEYNVYYSRVLSEYLWSLDSPARFLHCRKLQLQAKPPHGVQTLLLGVVVVADDFA